MQRIIKYGRTRQWGLRVVSVMNYLNQWLIAQKSSNDLLFTDYIPGDGAEQWIAPGVNTIKVNIDAAVFCDTSNYGVGFVARDSRDVFVEGSTKLF
uniref:Uncharacterized protein n=1 Tax=Cannabis sativa TaxID=3483 RepID=A0A803P8V2_CANSA